MLFNIIAVVVAFVLGAGYGAISMQRWNSKEEAKAKIGPVELVDHFTNVMDDERPTTISPRKVMEVVNGVGSCPNPKCSRVACVGEVEAGTELQCRCGALCFVTLPAPPKPAVEVVRTWIEVKDYTGPERRKNKRIEGKPWRAETREQMIRRG